MIAAKNNIIANLINMTRDDIQSISTRCEDELSIICSIEVSGVGQVSMSSNVLKLLERSLSLARY